MTKPKRGTVRFFSEGTGYSPKNKRKLKEWVEAVIVGQGRSMGNCNFIFCTDDYLLRINQKYLNKDDLTDVITFDMSEESDVIEGDVYLSIERIRENAQGLCKTIDNETHRVMIHGVLHLMGWKDKREGEKNAMREEEDRCLKKLGL
ncbi:MAG: rRNA maturation RNase YbeY [Bacteroidales bacterium]|nr:rRNA maturation RNase YbeY [Bacteroidales bacterium]